MRICCCSPPLFFAIAAIVVSFVANNIGLLKNVYKSPSFQRKSDSCRSLAGTDVKAKSCEDFRFVSENIIISGSGEMIAHLFEQGVKSPTTDHLIAIDVSTEKYRELPLTNFPKDIEFRPHGFDVRNGRVYVVNHAQHRTERLEIFELSNPDSIDRISVKWVTAIEPPVPKGALNSVAAVSEDEVYVTHWLPKDVPFGGLDNPKGLGESLNVTLSYLELLGSRQLVYLTYLMETQEFIAVT